MMHEASAGVMARAALLSIAALALALAPARVARAQEEVSPPARECRESTALPEDAAARDEAFALYAQSRERYSEGDFAAAVELLERAYAAYPEPVLMYNLARTLEGMARWTEAADAYECYLTRQPDARDRGAIERRVEALRASADAARLPPMPADPDGDGEGGAGGGGGDPPAAPSRSLDAGPFVLLALGAATVVAGGIVGGLALDLRNRADASAMHADAAGTFRTAEHYAIAANVSWGVAGALLLAGFVWGIVDWSASPAAPGEASIDVGIGLGSVSLALRVP